MDPTKSANAKYLALFSRVDSFRQSFATTALVTALRVESKTRSSDFRNPEPSGLVAKAPDPSSSSQIYGNPRQRFHCHRTSKSCEQALR